MTQDVWIGLDYGEETTAVCAVDADGRALLECAADSDAQAIAAVVQRLVSSNIRSVIIEGATTPHFARQLLACGLPLVVVDAQKASKILSFYRNKTDANDARAWPRLGDWVQPRACPRVCVRPNAVLSAIN